MPTWLLSLLVGIGFATWAYAKLAKMNGNANPGNNMIMAGVAGAIIFLVLFSLLKMVFNF